VTRNARRTLVGIAIVAVAFAALAFHHRWIADDGLIVVRTVKNIAAGHGPVYNAFERAESSTSTLWPWVLVVLAAITRLDPVFLAIYAGMAMSIGGVVLAMAATRRLHRGSDALLLPAGVLVLVGAMPFWDFASSGLETGLCTLWLALVWWLLVAATPERSRRFQLISAVVIGLGPLVRPDFGLVSAVGFVALWALIRPARRRTVLLVAAAIALPVAYEVFRAGYYGVLVPLPALAKGAANAEWARGFAYLVDYMKPYALYVPIAILCAIAVIHRRALVGRTAILVGATTLAALLMAGFVIRVGGDFMHARMLLPATFVALLPVLIVPWRRVTAPAIAAIAIWAVAIAIVRSDGKSHASAYRVFDERWDYTQWTGHEHPTKAEMFLVADGPSTKLVKNALRDHDHVLVSEGGFTFAANPARPEPVLYAVGRLGTGGATVPLEGIVVDVLGLANPFGAHITVNQPGLTGHEKSLPWAWIRADYTDPAIDTKLEDGADTAAIRAARHALTCGDVAELLASVRAPLTASRFFANLTGAIRRTRLEIPNDPYDAELEFCGPTNITPHIQASSSYEFDGWSAGRAIDGEKRSVKGSLGYSSEVSPFVWVIDHFGTTRDVSKVTLYPRSDALPGGGFPIDFQIQIWDGSKWIDRVVKTSYRNPGATPQTFTWSPPDRTDRIRIWGTKLPGFKGDGTRMQLAEIEVE